MAARRRGKLRDVCVAPQFEEDRFVQAIEPKFAADGATLAVVDLAAFDAVMNAPGHQRFWLPSQSSIVFRSVSVILGAALCSMVMNQAISSG